MIEWSWMSAVRLRVLCETGVRRLPSWATAQSTVEYALVGALVVIAAAAALTSLGGELTSVFTRISGTLAGAKGP